MSGTLPDPLASPKLKVQRAIAHARELESLILAFLRRDPFALAWRHDERGPDKHLFLQATEQPPEAIGLVIGDAVHNLRSALDHLMCCMARLNGHKSTDDVYFPFAKEGGEPFEANLRKKVRKLSAEAQELVREQKPYRGGDRLLYALHHIDLIDKHRTIATTQVYAFVEQFRTSYDQPIRLVSPPSFTLKDGIHILSAPKIANGEYDCQVGSDVAFADTGVLDGEPVVTTLDEMSARVQSVILLFERRFFS